MGTVTHPGESRTLSSGQRQEDGDTVAFSQGAPSFPLPKLNAQNKRLWRCGELLAAPLPQHREAIYFPLFLVPRFPGSILEEHGAGLRTVEL